MSFWWAAAEMPRPYHSPSSIALGLTCKRAWALQYIDGLRDPNLEWREAYTDLVWDFAANCFVLPSTGEKVSAAQRGSALGGALHLTAERWYESHFWHAPLAPAQRPDWDWFPGQVLASGKHLLPEPSKIERVIIEQAIGDVPLPKRERRHERDPDTAISVGGVLWAGYMDLEAHGRTELERLGMVAPDGVAIIDYKTTSKVEEYALTRAELLTDPQAALYAIVACKKLGLRSVPERWVYFESKKRRRALAIDVTAELSRAEDVMGPCADLARELDMITRSEDAPQNPLACNKYGNPDRINCRHHVSNGGTCDVKRRRFGALIQLTRKKEEIVMAAKVLTAEERKAAFEAKRAEQAAKAAGTTAPAEPTDEDKSDGETEAPESKEESEAPATPAVKPAQPKPAAAKLKVPEGSQAATISALALELAAADKARDAILERFTQGGRLIGFRSAGAAVAALVAAVFRQGQPAEHVNVTRKPELRGEYVVSAFCGRYGGQARWSRAVHLAHQNGKAPSETIESVRRGVAYDKHRAKRTPRMRTSTGLLAFPMR
jgi:hypothetical protein